MNERLFSSYVINGADALLEMMQRSPASYLKTARVLSIWQNPTIPTRFVLEVDDYVRAGAEIYCQDRPLPWAQIYALKMRRQEKKVLLRVPLEHSEKFSKLPPSSILVCSDMAFLIRRIKEFYLKHTLDFHPKPPQPLPICDNLPAFDYPLSQEQISAEHAVLSSPVSYVWGAPGTGKTKAVLARCLMRYILAEKRVLLLAPTNNALENALRSILPLMRNAGIDLKKVYRLGVASYEFGVEYPEVSGNAAVEERLAEIKAQLQAMEGALSECQALQEKRENAEAECRQLEQAIESLHPLLSAWALSYKTLQAVAQRHALQQQALEEAVNVLAITLEQQQKLHGSLSSKNKSICSLKKQKLLSCLTPWRKEHRAILQSRLQHYLQEQQSLSQQCADVDATVESMRQAVSTAHSEQENSASVLESAQKQADADRQLVVLQLRALGLPQIDEQDPEQLRQQLLGYLRQVQDSVHELEQSMPDRNEIQSTLDTLRCQCAAVEASDVLREKTCARILAGTVDSALPEMGADGAEPFAHVFIDEAAYLPLSKGMTVFSCACPVAFFGDHFQLPPICEMSDSQIREHPEVVLWALPAVCYSDLLNSKLDQLFVQHQSKSSLPSFSALTYVPLYKSYRFSSELATILDRHIYRTGYFTGAKSASLNITVLDAPRRTVNRKRESQEEAKLISAYLRHHSFAEESVAVLTPYRDQRKLLQSYCGQFGCPILTVHRAQGMEWDTVILSVVDTKDAYFVDSTLSVGQKCLNTAVSRVRKELIIVCDASFWRCQRGQLLSDLLQLDSSAQNTLSGKKEPGRLQSEVQHPKIK